MVVPMTSHPPILQKVNQGRESHPLSKRHHTVRSRAYVMEPRGAEVVRGRPCGTQRSSSGPGQAGHPSTHRALGVPGRSRDCRGPSPNPLSCHVQSNLVLPNSFSLNSPPPPLKVVFNFFTIKLNMMDDGVNQKTLKLEGLTLHPEVEVVKSVSSEGTHVYNCFLHTHVQKRKNGYTPKS